MITLSLIIWSKNKTSLNHFVLFLEKYLIYNSNTIAKYVQQKASTKIITVLKSPHVNKKSQEQFETTIFKKHFKITVQNDWKVLVFFRKICRNMCSDINIKIKQLFNSKYFLKKNLNIINLKNFKIKMYYNSVIKVRNFKFQKSLNLFKKSTLLNFIISKKAKQFIYIFQLYN